MSVQELVWTFWRREHLFTLQGFEPRTLQPVSSLYTIYAMPPPTGRQKMDRRAQKTGNLHKRNIKKRSRNHCCSGKAKSITHSERVSVVLVIWKAKRMRRIILLFVNCLSVLNICTLFHIRHDFLKKNVIEYKMCFDFLYNFRLKHFAL